MFSSSPSSSPKCEHPLSSSSHKHKNMVCNSSELTLDLRPPAPSRDFLTRFLVAENWDSVDLNKLNDFINGLENELTKIQAFKRELPLSVMLLNDAIDKLKEEARKRIGAKLENDHEKKSWMSSAQLWSPRSEEERGAFLSFREEDSGIPATEEEEEDASPELSLLTPSFNTVEPGSWGGVSAGPGFYSTGAKAPSHQTARKQRRCWSPDLHRRFVDALAKLGGSQVATPKQIKELMEVDGLTNDEVKSHLQKYRLHIRKLSSSGTSTPSTGRSQVHELGCSSKEDLPHTHSPQGPLHLARSGKCNSTSMEEDEHEEKSDGHSWKVEHHM